MNARVRAAARDWPRAGSGADAVVAAAAAAFSGTAGGRADERAGRGGQAPAKKPRRTAPGLLAR